MAVIAPADMGARDIEAAVKLRKEAVACLAAAITNLRKVEARGRETVAPRVEAVDVQIVIAAFPDYLHADMRDALRNL